MAPIASGTYRPLTLIHSFVNRIAGRDCRRRFRLTAGRSRHYADGNQPQLVAGLLVDTVPGVALFRGVRSATDCGGAGLL